jgi:hypothetical protein
MLATSSSTSGTEVSTVAPHFETRVGKRRWNERSGKGKRGGVVGWIEIRRADE